MLLGGGVSSCRWTCRCLFASKPSVFLGAVAAFDLVLLSPPNHSMFIVLKTRQIMTETMHCGRLIGDAEAPSSFSRWVAPLGFATLPVLPARLYECTPLWGWVLGYSVGRRSVLLGFLV